MGISPRAENKDGLNWAGQEGAFAQRRRVGEVRAPQKTLAFFEGGRIWSSPHGRARMAEPRASGPAALFALWVVFEAAALIYGGVYDALKLYAQKARGSRGRDPEEPPRGGGDERPRACYAMGPLPLVNVQRIILKKRKC